MQVQDIMSHTVITVRPDTRVSEVIRVFREHGISGVPVVDDAGDLVGIITEKDVVARHARPHFPHYIQVLDSLIYLERPTRYEESMRRILATTASELMTEEVTTVSPDLDVQDLAALMVEEGINPVPVVDGDDRLIGIVSRTDVLNIIEQAEEKGS
jgi:CBS domain-containing protein